MLTREERQDVKDFLLKKSEINKNIRHNNSEIKRLELMLEEEGNSENRKILEVSVRFGRGKISLQKTEVLMLSARKIAKIIGVDHSQVRYQETLFNKSKVFL